MNQAFLDYYRCPERFADFRLAHGQPTNGHSGYFRLGSDLICYGTAAVQGRPEVSDSLLDVSSQVRIDGSTCLLPFDPTEIANNFRYELYVKGIQKPAWEKLVRDATIACGQPCRSPCGAACNGRG